jgi:hypothetical protein
MRHLVVVLHFVAPPSHLPWLIVASPPPLHCLHSILVVLLWPLSLAMDNGEFDHSGSGGGGAALAAVDDRDRGWWRLMTAAALDRGNTTTSWCRVRVAKQEYKRPAQGEAMQQPAHLPP